MCVFIGSMTSATSPIILKWDPKSLEIRTLTVERLLEPLVTQVRDALKYLVTYACFHYDYIMTFQRTRNPYACLSHTIMLITRYIFLPELWTVLLPNKVWSAF